mgnify:CR=1 FL=1
MNSQKNIRWKQRFQNFEKAYTLLERTVQIQHPNEVEKGGMIQFFEMAFELSWKMLKDYLEAEGFQVQSPRETIKTAFQQGFITQGHDWIDALEDRNLTVHTYDENTADLVVDRIVNKYFLLLKELYKSFKEASRK